MLDWQISVQGLDRPVYKKNLKHGAFLQITDQALAQPVHENKT